MSKDKDICWLALEDGTVFKGKAFGDRGETTGEVVFNTSMSGYQEILTDPSYAGQIVTMTYPEIGNYGINFQDFESRAPFVEGFIVRECSRIASNWRAKGRLQDFLVEYGIVGIEGVDTRAITKRLRTVGAMRGVISSLDDDRDSLVRKARDCPSLIGRDLIKDVTCAEPFVWGEESTGKYRVVAIDCGMKLNILRRLKEHECRVDVVPAWTSAEQILDVNPDGIFISNGPGDPAGAPYLAKTLRSLLGKKPIFGICLGHQILGMALGGTTYKLKFGHRGGNQPVKDLLTGKVEITSQNHGFAVDAASMVDEAGCAKADSRIGRVEITHLNLNDKTVEGLRCMDIPAFSVQYHPEAAPGPHDATHLFTRFVEMMNESAN